ncbi:glycosyl transferase [Vibrio breoganii]|uniref:DUF1972 domain-containing protein n=1 Tax=Vibrio breoganii TaxID=553239 RepID=UPI000C862521|nr:DUF1972 domain-containing protein [Vibrio breoganii]PMM86854.1 glycosyl transferase [Vibrio breoganii]
MNIVVIGTVGIPACYGGFESLVENITLNSSNDIDYTVFCSGKAYKTTYATYNDADLIYLPLQANGSQSILYDIWSFIKTLSLKPDAVVVLGVSGCVFLPVFKLFSKAKIITNIDGLEWKRDKWNLFVKKFLKFSERVAVRFSDTVVTDNQAITDYVFEEYGVKSETIAYGGDHAIRYSEEDSPKKNYALGLCRIEPENNVEMILDSFSKLSMPIKFVGNWNNSEFGRKLKAKYSQFNNIFLLDPIYDLDELYKLRKGCALYLHGHSAGGTNPSLVEMMHFGCPIVAFDCSFNRYSTDNKAHYFLDSQSLIALTQSVTDKQKIQNGSDMLALAKERYTWSKIARQYEATY